MRRYSPRRRRRRGTRNRVGIAIWAYENGLLTRSGVVVSDPAGVSACPAVVSLRNADKILRHGLAGTYREA
ncbi:hypothetical protein GCM10027615_37500 [Plantactinospora veratri]